MNIKNLLMTTFLFVMIKNYHSQLTYEIGLSFGGNATISKTEHTSNRTKGFRTPFVPNTWLNLLYLGIHKNKHSLVTSFETGALGVWYKVKNNTNKYPEGYSPDPYSTNFFGVNGRNRANTTLKKWSLTYKYNWLTKNKFTHFFCIGTGYLKTYKNHGNLNATNGFMGYFDGLGIVSHTFTQDYNHYNRLTNGYLVFGYELAYKITDHWNLKAQIFYNQGFFKMIEYHTYRFFSESLSGYTEFDEQWSYTRLSYCSFATGISYTFSMKKRINGNYDKENH